MIRVSDYSLTQFSSSPAYSTKNESYRYLCNHRRAYKLFTDSISPKCKFTAFPCDSYEKFESGECFQCNSEVCVTFVCVCVFLRACA